MKLYAAKLSAGTGEDNSINAQVLQNDLGAIVAWEKTAEGEYRGTCELPYDAFPAGRVAPFSYENQGGTVYAEVHELDGNRVVVKQFHGRSGNAESGPEIYIEIKVFPA